MRKFFIILLLFYTFNLLGEQTELKILDSDVSFKGIFSKKTVWFRVPELWQVVEVGTIKAKFRFSNILDLDMSSLTFYINDVPAQSIKLKQYKSKEDEWIETEIFFPSEIILKGWNKFQVKAYLRSRTHDCDDKDNPGLWLVLSEDSKVALKWVPVELSPDLSKFPASYSEIIDPLQKKANITYVLPKNATYYAMSVVGVVAGLVGSRNETDYPNIKAYIIGKTQKINLDTHIVIAGTYPNIKPFLEELKINAQVQEKFKKAKIDESSGIIIELISPAYKHRRILILTSYQEKGLEKLYYFLGNKKYLKELSSDVMVIKDIHVQKNSKKITKSFFTFEELNIEDIIVRGYSGLKEVSFTLNFPSYILVGEKNELILYIRKSEIVDPHSTLEIDISHVPIASVLLGEKLKDRIVYEMHIPIQKYYLKNPGRIDFTFRFMIEVKTDDCSLSTFENAWVIIEKRSGIKFDIESEENNKLFIYPYKHVEEYDSSKFKIVIPFLTQKYVETALAAFYSVGFVTKSRQLFYPAFLTQSHFGRLNSKKNNLKFLYISKWIDSKFLMQNQNNFPVYLDDNLIAKSKYYSFFHPDEFYTDFVLAENVNLKGNLYTILTGIGSNFFKLSKLFVTLWYPSFEGNVALLKSDRVYYTYDVVKPEKKPVTKKQNKKVKKAKKNQERELSDVTDNYLMLKIIILIVAFLILFGIFIYVKKSLKKGSKEGKNKS